MSDISFSEPEKRKRKPIDPRPGIGSYVCGACGTEFPRRRSSVFTETVYCSHRCHAKNSPPPTKHKKDTTRDCRHCGRSFAPKAEGASTAVHCSIKCFNESRKGWNHGAAHPLWKGGLKRYRTPAVNAILRAAVREAGQCGRCGVTEFLHGHHIKPVSTHPELAKERANIEVLCRDCHALEHPEYAPLILRSQSQPKHFSTCETCAQSMRIFPHQVGKKRFCSVACRRVPRVEVPCRGCGQVRTFHRSRRPMPKLCLKCWRASGNGA